MRDVDRLAVAPDISRQMMERAREFRHIPTPSEERLWGVLRNRQQAIGPFIVDFFCSEHRLIVEVDGPIHDAQREHDEERQRMLEACGYRVIRVSADAVETDLSDALLTITMSLNESRSPSPLRVPSGQERGGRGVR